MNSMLRETTKIKAVLFDAVGTLFRSRGTIAEIYTDVALSHSVSVDARKVGERLRHRIPGGAPRDKHDWRALVESVFAGLGQFPDFEAFFEDLWQIFRSGDTWRCYPETVTVLEQLKQHGYMLGIVSNFDGRLHQVLKDLEIDAYFQVVVTPEFSGYAKPDPRIFLAATAAIGVDPSEALFAGDDRNQDFEGAQRSGLHAVWLVRNHATPGPGLVCDLSGVLPLLEALQHPST